MYDMSAARRAQVTAYLTDNPGASAEAVYREIGGYRQKVFALVREIRPTLPVAPQPEGQMTDLNYRLIAMGCCGYSLQWLNYSLPAFCPACGTAASTGQVLGWVRIDAPGAELTYTPRRLPIHTARG